MKASSPYGPRADMLRDEFENLRQRLPALAEKVWTSYHTPDPQSFMSDLALLDRSLNKLL